MRRITFESSVVREENVDRPMWHLSEPTSGLDVSCDAVTTEPFRYALYGRMRQAMDTVLASNKMLKRGDALMAFSLGRRDVETGVQNLMNRPLLGRGVMNLAWLFGLTSNAAKQLMLVAWSMMNKREWDAQC
jgi:hypothetical protein